MGSRSFEQAMRGGAVVAMGVGILLTFASRSYSEPQPGDVFREHIWSANGAVLAGTDMNFTIPGSIDLENATKAEAVVHIENQHLGYDKYAVKVNSGKWNPLPYPATVPQAPSPSLRYQSRFALTKVDLADFKSGSGNTCALTMGGAMWDGQQHVAPWSLVHAFTIRIYYDPEKKPHPTGKILTPSTGSAVSGNVPFTAQVAPPSGGAIDRVDYVGKYLDVDWNGDCVYYEWQYMPEIKLQHNVGTSSAAPYSVTWETDWIPDQPSPIKIGAWISDKTNLRYFTETIDLTFKRQFTIEICQPYDQPTEWATCNLDLGYVHPGQTEKFDVKTNPAKIVGAYAAVYTWGSGATFKINNVQLTSPPTVNGLATRCKWNWAPVTPYNMFKAGQNTFSTNLTPYLGTFIMLPGGVILIKSNDPTGVHDAGELDKGKLPQAANGRSSAQPERLFDIRGRQFTAASGTPGFGIAQHAGGLSRVRVNRACLGN